MILVMIIMLPKSKVPHEYLNFHTVMHQIKVAQPHSSADDSELKKLDCSMIQKVIQCRTIRDSFIIIYSPVRSTSSRRRVRPGSR